MKKLFVLFTFIAFYMPSYSQDTDSKLQYPETRKDNTVDDYFGTKVSDPYRWLEDDNSDETKAWVQSENKVTFGYLDKIPYRDEIHKRITELYNFPRVSTPYRKGNYYFFTKNDGLQPQNVFYYQQGMNGTPQVLIDPNTINDKGTSFVSLLGFSNDKKMVAYSVSESGSDWEKIYVKDLSQNKQLPDQLEWVKFSGAAWHKDGFYYSGYDVPEKGSEYTGKNQLMKLYYHKLGDQQSQDRVVWADYDHPLRTVGAQTTEDEKFLFLYLSEGTYGTEIWCMDLRNPHAGFRKILEGFAYNYNVIDDEGENLIVQTNNDAKNYQLVLIDPKHPEKENWKPLIPESENLLDVVQTSGGKIFCRYLKDASSQVIQFDRKGNKEREINIPMIGTVDGFSGEKDDTTLFYSITSFTSPSTIYLYNIKTGTSTLYKKPEVKFNPDDYVTKQVFYPSKDGTKIPMFIVYKKGTKLNGKNPTLLYGYGGFNIARRPDFIPSRLVLLENGGVFAVACIRGGSEYGEKWHQGGMLLNKQNVFDDFISAAEYLIAQKYTSKDYLAIMGRSNGGLLIGACETQRPDLYKVCIPMVGVMDMLRYQKFTIGWAWAVEYGSSDSAKYFKNLYSYSPLHNIKAGTKYPATLITTGDHDDRVVPSHSFKYAATLQAAQAGDAPILIRVDVNAGHSGGGEKPINKLNEEEADIYSFILWNMGVKKLKEVK